MLILHLVWSVLILQGLETLRKHEFRGEQSRTDRDGYGGHGRYFRD
ncbi:hypothetical protein M758_1G174400 [Ceratodon purpureus]|nr:hypothetical protein M758_1G174400 [Ceratodon purpureus]